MTLPDNEGGNVSSTPSLGAVHCTSCTGIPKLISSIRDEKGAQHGAKHGRSCFGTPSKCVPVTGARDLQQLQTPVPTTRELTTGTLSSVPRLRPPPVPRASELTTGAHDAPRLRPPPAKLRQDTMRATWVQPSMVAAATPAPHRKFSVKEMLKSNKWVYNVKEAPTRIKQRLRGTSKCSAAYACVKLLHKSSAQVRRELHKMLSQSLATGEHAPAFAKDIAFNDCPRADEIEDMVAQFMAAAEINWDAEPVQSGINVPLWHQHHSRHCKLCSDTHISRDCYFNLIYHFLKTGFEPPVKEGCTLTEATQKLRAYVDKWRQEDAGCRAAFEKWEQKLQGLLSDPTDVTPEAFFPLLPVVRAKDRWRFIVHGMAYKVRLCMDFKAGKLNEKLVDLPFRYWGLDAVAENVQQGDWLAVIDISNFYLRLPAGRNLRKVQWFQDPSSYASCTHNNERMKESKLRFRQILSVAFGLKSAPAYASMVSAELVRIFKSFGINVAGVYLDDILIRAESKEKCEQAIALACKIAADLGLPINDKTVGPCAPSTGIVYLGILIKTDHCTMAMTEEHRAYTLDRLHEIISQRRASVKQLETLGGLLSWVSYVHVPGRPRRNFVFRELTRMRQRAESKVTVRGDLMRQLRWWQNSLRSSKLPSSYFWNRQPNTPLLCSDASGEDGWGACCLGMHFAGPWPEEWQQSAGAGAPHMLFKEVLPPGVTSLLVAPFLRDNVMACATDNSGAAFTLNSLSCACTETLKILRPVADCLTRSRVGLVADHAHRERNQHSDDLSHALPMHFFRRYVPQVAPRRGTRTEVHFAVLDLATDEAYTATLSFERILPRDVSAAQR